MPRSGPGRLGAREILASIYPYLFATIYRNWVRTIGRDGAGDKAVAFLTLLLWVPLVIVPPALLLAGSPLGGYEPAFWAYAIATAAGTWAAHHHWLVRRGAGRRFLRCHARLGATDRRRVRWASVALLALYVAGFFAFVRWADAGRAVPVVIATESNAAETR